MDDHIKDFLVFPACLGVNHSFLHNWLYSPSLKKIMEKFMPAQWSFQDAKNKFSEVVKAASTGQPQVVVEQGVPTVVVISKSLYEYYKSSSPDKPSFKEMLLSIPKNDDDSLFSEDR